MNITLNNTNHQVTMGVGKNGVLKFALGNSEKMSFGELQDTMISKATSDEERESAKRFMQIPDKFIEQAQARVAKSRLFNLKLELANAGNMDARNDIINLFDRFGLSRFLTENMNDRNNFVTNLLSMNQRERLAFLELEDYILAGNRIQ